jgi:hypothetical protein
MQPECTIGQGFGGNATATYKAGGLLGHTGIDNDCGFGSLIHSYWDSEYVYKVLTKDHPSNDGTGFTGVFTIVEQNGVCFEFLYGHCNPSPDLLGKTITKGTVIGTQANNGEVYSGGVRITLEMQKAGDTRGTHRHDQARLLKKVPTVDGTSKYLSALGGGYLYLNGFFYLIPDYNNGYNGCFDWTKPFGTTSTSSPTGIVGGSDKFIAMQKAILDFQLSEGIRDYANAPLKDVKIGNKTLRAIKKYL